MKLMQNLSNWKCTDINEYRGLKEDDVLFILCFEQLMIGNKKYMVELLGDVISESLIKEMNYDNNARRRDIMNIGSRYRKPLTSVNAIQCSEFLCESISSYKSYRSKIASENGKKSRGIKRDRKKKQIEENIEKKQPIKSKNIRSEILLDPDQEYLRDKIYSKKRKNGFKCFLKDNNTEIQLARYIMSVNDSKLLITFKNGNTLDFRRSNLLVGDKKTISKYINKK